MRICILKYNAGNVRSVSDALNRMGANDFTCSDDPLELQQADKVIMPGVGEAGTAMQYLRQRGLDQVLISLRQPVLGICLGLQLMCQRSAEGSTKCLEIFDTSVEKFSGSLKIPHMGWNNISGLRGPLFESVAENSFVYFVHSYYAVPNSNTTARCCYGQEFSAAIQCNNFYALQFHPEKSGQIGEQILRNFINLK